MKLGQIRKVIKDHIDTLEKQITPYQQKFDAIVRVADIKGVNESDFIKMKDIATQTVFPRDEQEIWLELLAKVDEALKRPMSEYKENDSRYSAKFFNPTPLQKAFNDAFTKSCQLLLKHPAKIVTTKVLTGPHYAQIVDISAGMSREQFVANGRGHESHRKLYKLKEIIKQGKYEVDVKPIHVELSSLFSVSMK